MQNIRYIDEREVSRMTGRALPTLRNDRHKGRGIPYAKIGRSVRYSVDDVISFMEKRKIATEEM
jgi:predicted DNA-binding transcriptional regulator AlpA